MSALKKISKISFFSLSLLVLSLMATKTVNAQFYSLSPSSASKSVGEEYSVDLNLDTEGKAVVGADVKMTYDSAMLEVVRVDGGDFFDETPKNLNNAGSVYIGGTFKDVFDTKTGSGKVATLVLKGKKEGSAQLVFVCTTQTNDTNVVDASAHDIVNCTSTKNGTYTFSAASSSSSSESSSSTSTTSTTTTTTTSSTAQPTAIPKLPATGITLPTFMTLGLGAVLTVVGIALVF